MYKKEKEPSERDGTVSLDLESVEAASKDMTISPDLEAVKAASEEDVIRFPDLEAVEAASEEDVTTSLDLEAVEAASEEDVTISLDLEAVKAASEEDVTISLDLEAVEAALKKEQYRSSYSKVLRSTVFSLIVVAAAAVLVAVLILPVLQISGTSMTESLQDGDIVVAVNSKRFETGDVIAFYYNNNTLVKRVIANAGDWVDIDGAGNVSVNGELIEEPYVTEKALGECDIEMPYQVPDGKCFVMGDHRATSIDSRNTAVGCVEKDMIVGRIVFRVWPLSDFGIIR